MLGSDEDHAVGAFGTIDGGSGSVLKDSESLDILDVEVVDVLAFETINQDVCALGCAESRDTAYPELGFVLTGLTGSLHGHHARDVAGECVGDVGCGEMLHVAHIYVCHGTCHRDFLTSTHTGDHDLAELILEFVHLQVVPLSAEVLYVDLEGLHAYERDHNGLGIVRDVEHPVAIDISHSAYGSALHHHSGTDKGLTIDGTCDIASIFFGNHGKRGNQACRHYRKKSLIHCRWN